MYFFWIFGDRVERMVGHFKFIIIYLLGGIVGVLAFTASAKVAHDYNTALLGASGAISAVMGAYLVLLPKDKIRMTVMFIFWWASSAWLVIVYYFIVNFLNMLQAGDGVNVSVAYSSHVFALIFGAWFSWILILLAGSKFRLLPRSVVVYTDEADSDGLRKAFFRKRWNVIVPETVADKFGVDVVRMYLMFMGPFDATMAWNEKTLMGVKRFLDRFEIYVNKQMECLGQKSEVVSVVDVVVNKTIQSITEDFKRFSFNTAIAKLMSLTNELGVSSGCIGRNYIEVLIKLIAPFAPYAAEELWDKLGNELSVHLESWPVANEKYLVEDEVNIPVAINGKVREQLKISSNSLTDQEMVLREAKNLDKVKEWIGGSKIVKEIYVPGKMVNLVVQ
jgi:hypothetical protein